MSDTGKSESHGFTIELEQQDNYEFLVRFDMPGVETLRLDEPVPLGQGHGPNAARLVAAAVANCLSASLLFCVQGKFKQQPGRIRARATAQLERNERGRMRIAGIDVAIQLADRAESLAHLDRCLAQFEDFCVVTQSVRGGIPVSVQVIDADGQALSVPAAG